VIEPVVSAGEAHIVAGEHGPADLDRLLQHVQAHPVTRIVDAEALVLNVVPGAPDAEDGPAREMTSSVVMILARMPGLRYVTPVTSVPSCTRRVRAASAPSRVYASSIGWSGPPRGGSWKK